MNPKNAHDTIRKHAVKARKLSVFALVGSLMLLFACADHLYVVFTLSKETTLSVGEIFEYGMSQNVAPILVQDGTINIMILSNLLHALIVGILFVNIVTLCVCNLRWSRKVSDLLKTES